VEVAACRIWLELELRLVKPDIVVALGTTAAQGLLGPAFRVTKQRGKIVSSPLRRVSSRRFTRRRSRARRTLSPASGRCAHS
jgi:uracil-DNA glycosylase family 4